MLSDAATSRQNQIIGSELHTFFELGYGRDGNSAWVTYRGSWSASMI